MRFFTPLTALTLVAVAASCSSDTTKPPVPVDCSSVADTTQPATVSFQNDIFALFLEVSNGGYGCNNSGCHGSPFIASHYAVSTYDEFLTPGDQAQALNICVIKPGDPENSYLVWKLEGRTGIDGVQMPQTGAKMTPQDITLVRTWILEGARNN